MEAGYAVDSQLSRPRSAEAERQQRSNRSAVCLRSIYAGRRGGGCAHGAGQRLPVQGKRQGNLLRRIDSTCGSYLTRIINLGSGVWRRLPGASKVRFRKIKCECIHSSNAELMAKLVTVRIGNVKLMFEPTFNYTVQFKNRYNRQIECENVRVTHRQSYIHDRHKTVPDVGLRRTQ
jgi:hypothetical protein